jgi:predicted dinucleotide-binding enzyme
MTTLGFIGSGRIGGTLAKLAVADGHQVVMSNSRGPEALAELIALLGPNARAATSVEAAEAADVAVIAVPFSSYRDVPVEQLAGKVVIDVTNYYPGRDGVVAELESGTTTSSELLQAHLPTSAVVKAFNHIPAADLAQQGLPAGALGRRALALAGDDPGARSVVAKLIDGFGFDPVDLGPLAEGWRVSQLTPQTVARLDRNQLAELASSARR